MKKTAAIEALSALAQETRLEIFRFLVQAGAAGVPAGRIGERLGLPSPTLSFHLAQLKHAGLVLSRREGRSIIYAANYPAMTRLLAYLTENCCKGESACAPAACAPASGRAEETSQETSDEAPARPRFRRRP